MAGQSKRKLSRLGWGQRSAKSRCTNEIASQASRRSLVSPGSARFLSVARFCLPVIAPCEFADRKRKHVGRFCCASPAAGNGKREVAAPFARRPNERLRDSD